MGSGIHSSPFTAGGAAPTAGGLQLTAGSCRTLQRRVSGQHGQCRQRGQCGQCGQHGQRGQRGRCGRCGQCGQCGQRGGRSAPACNCPIRLDAQGCPGSSAAKLGLAVPGRAGGQELAGGDPVEDGNLLIQALLALQCESGTVFFTTS